VNDHSGQNRLLPLDDERNRRLRDLVHPTDWPVRPSAGVYDLVAIGGGTAGLVAAGGAALLGARAALVERAYLGGDCLVTGCVPSKALIRAAAVAHEARRAAEFGIRTGPIEVDFPAVMDRVRRVRADMARHDGAEEMRQRGADVLFGTARFTGPRALDLDGVPIRFRRAVICTGGRPDVPDVPGLRENGLTSETVFELTELPGRLLVVGGGPIGCELAQAFARLGSRVTVLQRGDRLLPRDDPDAGSLIAEVLRAEGAEVRFGTVPARVERDGAELRVVVRGPAGDEVLAADKVLVAAGRRPNLEGLNLEAAGVAADAGGVRVDWRHRTTNRRVYAAGDVCSPLRFTHAAYAQAEYACLNALLPLRLNARDRVMSWTTYTDPEVAHVGMGWAALRELKDRLDTWTAPLALNDRAQTEGETRGFARIHCRRGSDRIVAATVVARHAGEIIAPLAVAITNGWRLRHIHRTILPYPTRAEVIRKIADQWKFSTLTPGTKWLVGLWFQLSRLWG
jgi:pyruvate/2-oxoglutarate dehydrogenase complex dihydrolipoamide dehydrogenase (E3) component